ncbi:MAG: phosphocholine cytidylyltransferase family protein [Prevotella sp.]|nr:phosphocholine cytidylyltransferase family protein [Prevotella sp.]
MIGVILAAGMAKRLRPLTDTKPKCLLKVGERTLLERTVRAMQQAGITEFVVVTGYRAEQIRDFLTPLAHRRGDGGEALNFHYLHNADYEHNNNIYSLWMAGEYVRGKEFLLMDSDILCDPAAVARIAHEPESALALNRHECGEEEIKVIVDANGHITEISKVCSIKDAIGESVGIEKMTADYSEALYKELDQMILKEGLIDVFYERCFERLIPQGHTFKVVDTTSYFSYELDTPEDFERAKELMPKELL